MIKDFSSYQNYFFRHDSKSGSVRIPLLGDIFKHVVLLCELFFQDAIFVL